MQGIVSMSGAEDLTKQDYKGTSWVWWCIALPEVGPICQKALMLPPVAAPMLSGLAVFGIRTDPLLCSACQDIFWL